MDAYECASGHRSPACAACASIPPLPSEPPPISGRHSRAEPLHSCAGCVHTSISGPETYGTSRQGFVSFTLPTSAHPAKSLRGVVSPDALVAVIPPCRCEGGHHSPASVSARKSPSDCFHTCLCGASWNVNDLVPNAKDTVLFTDNEPLLVRMHSIRCSRTGCGSLLPYDGAGQGIFAFSARVAIRESMLISAMVQLSQGSTFDAIATQWQTAYKFCNPRVAYEHLPQRWLLRLLIRSYLQLLPDIDVVCPCCGHHPLTLIADGTSLGCKMSLGKAHLQPDGRDTLPVNVAESFGAPSETFHFINEVSGARKHREVLYRFVLPPSLVDGRPAPGGCSTTPMRSGVTSTEFSDLLSWCRARGGRSEVMARRLTSLAVVLEHVAKLPESRLPDSRLRCPESWAHLLQPLVVPSASWLSFEPAEQCAVLKALKIPNALGLSRSAADLRARATLVCPFIVDFLDAMNATHFPSAAIELIDELCRMATTLAIQSAEPRYTVLAIDSSPLTIPQLQTRVSLMCSEADSAEQTAPASAAAAAARKRADAAGLALARVAAALEFVDTTVSEDRSRGIWASPGYRHRRVQTFAYRAKDDRVNLCSKGVPDSGGFTPGLLILACPHGYIYYIQFMRGGESPAMVLEFLRDRCYPRELPVRICYDNGCNLHAYVARRCPDIAASVQFIIDRLHNRNHTHCSIAFQLDRYTHHERGLNFNTQRVEQLNRMLRKLATNLRFSRPDNGIDTLRVFMMLFAYQRQDAAPPAATEGVSAGGSVESPLDSDESGSLDEDVASLLLSRLAA